MLRRGPAPKHILPCKYTGVGVRTGASSAGSYTPSMLTNLFQRVHSIVPFTLTSRKHRGQESKRFCVVCIVPSLLQLVIIKWHAKVWGSGQRDSPDLHTSILQEVRPTRTGLRTLASTVTVYHVPKAAAVEVSLPGARQ